MILHRLLRTSKRRPNASLRLDGISLYTSEPSISAKLDLPYWVSRRRIGEIRGLGWRKLDKERVSNRALTDKLRELMASVHTTRLNDEGGVDMISKSERLAELIADRALGWEETVDVPDKKVSGRTVSTVVRHKPEKWAIVMVYERLEGKTPMAVADVQDTPKVADRVSDLAKKSVNALTEEETEEEPDDGSSS